MNQELKTAIEVVKPFLPKMEYRCMMDGLKGEEAQYFGDKFQEIAILIGAMPKTYEQEGLGDEAVVNLHYFRGSMDWYITEKDCEEEQHQAFGLADLGQVYPELGYISIVELVAAGVELDLHFRPKTLGEIKAKKYGKGND